MVKHGIYGGRGGRGGDVMSPVLKIGAMKNERLRISPSTPRKPRWEISKSDVKRLLGFFSLIPNGKMGV